MGNIYIDMVEPSASASTLVNSFDFVRNSSDFLRNSVDEPATLEWTGSSSSQGVRAEIIAHTTVSPVTFKAVMHLSRNQSIATINSNPFGVPVVLKTVLYAVMTNTRPGDGTGAAPAEPIVDKIIKR